MPQVRAWVCRFFGLFRKNRRDAEMAEEIQQHVDLLTERNIAAGMSPTEFAQRGVARIRWRRTNQGNCARATRLAMGRRICSRHSFRRANAFADAGLFDFSDSLFNTRHRHKRRGLELDRRNFDSAVSARRAPGPNVRARRHNARRRRGHRTFLS